MTHPIIPCATNDYAGSFATLSDLVTRARLVFVLESTSSGWHGRLWVSASAVDPSDDGGCIEADATTPDWVAAIILEKLPKYAECMERLAEGRLEHERDLLQRLRSLR